MIGFSNATPLRSLATALGLSALFLVADAGITIRAQSPAPLPLELRSVMREMKVDLQAVTEAIALEDWARVASLAPRIGDHRKPSVEERTRIMEFLGQEAIKFKSSDDAVHEAADAMQQAAERRDGRAVIGAFAAIQNACLGCHQSFRGSLIKHFYKN